MVYTYEARTRWYTYEDGEEDMDETLEERNEEEGKERARRLATLKKRRQRENEKTSREKRVMTEQQRCD